MIYLKSVLVGVAVLMVSLLLFVLISVLPLLVGRPGSGSGGFATIVTIGPSFWIVVVVIFAAGFWWEFRRASR